MIVATDMKKPETKTQMQAPDGEGCLGPLLLLLAIFFAGFACGYYYSGYRAILEVMR